MYERRRMMLSESKELGQIIITAADSTNYVKVGDVTYTAPITLPIREELLVAMPSYTKKSTGYGSSVTKKNFSWQVEDGKALTMTPRDEDDNCATFISLMGHIYVIDAVNKTIHVTRPKDWNGFIFASDEPHYPYAPIYSFSNSPWRGVQNGIYFMYCPYGGGTGVQAGGISFYPVDLTGFSSVYGRSINYSNDNGSSAFGFCICPDTHACGTISSDCVLDAKYTDGGSTNADISLSKNYFTLSINLRGEYCVTWDNAYASTGTCIRDLWFNK